MNPPKNPPTTPPTAPTEEAPEVWVLLTFEPLTQVCTVAGCGRSPEECGEGRDRVDALYQKMFQFWPLPPVGMLARGIEQWFRSCGVTKTNSSELRSLVAKSVGDMFHRIRTGQVNVPEDLKQTLGLDRSGPDRGDAGDGEQAGGTVRGQPGDEMPG